MNWFYSLITGFCGAGVCFGALYIICPSGKMEASVKYIISLSFLVVIIALAGVNVKRTNFNFEISKDISVEAKDLQLASAKQVFSLTLENSDINFSKIEVSVDNSETESISINKVTVYSNEGRQKIINALGGSSADFEVEVINE